MIPADLSLVPTESLSLALHDLVLLPYSADSISWKAQPGKDLSFKEAWHLIRSREAQVVWAPFIWHSLMLPQNLILLLETNAQQDSHPRLDSIKWCEFG